MLNKYVTTTKSTFELIQKNPDSNPDSPEKNLDTFQTVIERQYLRNYLNGQDWPQNFVLSREVFHSCTAILQKCFTINLLKKVKYVNCTYCFRLLISVM